MLALALALTLAGSPPPPHGPGTFRRAALAADGTHVAVFLYVPERPIPGAPLVVLLPDLGTTHEVFDVDGDGLARQLSGRGLAVATLDWRGTGLSQVPAQPASLDDLLTLDLPTAANVEGADRKLVLVGWGYSGALAYAAASGVLARRTVGVVSLNGVVSLDVPNATVERLFAAGDAVDLPLVLANPAPQRRGTLFDLLWTQGAPLDDTVAGDLLVRALAPISELEASQLRDWMRDGKTTLGGRPYPDQLGKLEAPVLAFLGMRDNWTHPEFAGPIRDWVPEKRLQFEPVNRFEGYDEDLGHLGLVLGHTCDKQLVPLMVEFIRSKVMASYEASR